jgi:hypothetical protein
MDDDTIAEMVRRKTWYVPTIDHNRYYADNYKLLGYPEKALDDLNDYIARNLSTAKKALENGHALGGFGRSLYNVRRKHARTRLVRQGRHEP